MQDIANSFSGSLKSLARDDWYAALAERVEDGGFLEPLDDAHSAVFTPGEKVLLVTFENRQGIQALMDTGEPLGFEMARATQWAHLGLISEGDTWFRSEPVFDFFEGLEDEEFFETFERVVFYGAGPCGYAAAAFARAAQDAVVVAVQPQATLDPRVTGWDLRFVEQRRLDFGGRFGYAPEFLDLTEKTYVIFDPNETLDAMHASLFLHANTTRLRTPYMGAALQASLMDMSLLLRILARAGSGKLTEAWFYAALRARRSYPPYLRALLAAAERLDRPDLAEAICVNVTSRMSAPRFARKLQQLRATNP